MYLEGETREPHRAAVGAARRGGPICRSLLVSQLLLGDDHLLHMPVNLPLHFLAVFGGVAQANTSYVPQVLEGELEFINAAPKKKEKPKGNMDFFFLLSQI